MLTEAIKPKCERGEACSGLDGGPRARRVRKGGFVAASIAVAMWPE
jgi:hypothetical protein